MFNVVTILRCVRGVRVRIIVIIIVIISRRCHVVGTVATITERNSPLHRRRCTGPSVDIIIVIIVFVTHNS